MFNWNLHLKTFFWVEIRYIVVVAAAATSSSKILGQLHHGALKIPFNPSILKQINWILQHHQHLIKCLLLLFWHIFKL